MAGEPQVHARAGVVKSLKARWPLALTVFLLVAVPGSIWSWQKGRPVFEARASIHVSPTFVKTLEDDAETRQQTNMYFNHLQQQVYVIKRYDVIEQTLKALGEERILWQHPDETDTQAVERLQQDLEVEAVSDAYLVNVALQGDSPDGLAQIVNTVVDSYLAVLPDEYFFQSEDRIETLAATRAEVTHEIAAAMERKSQLAEELGVSSFAPTSENPYQTSLLEASDALSKGRRELILARSNLEGIAASQELVLALEMQSEAELMLNEEGHHTTLLAPLMARKSALQGELAGLTPEHPGFESTKGQLDEIEQAIEALMQGEIERTTAILDRRRRTRAAEERANLQAAADKAANYVASLEQQYQELRDQGGWFVTRYQQGVELERSIERLLAKREEIDNRVDFLELEPQAPGFARLASPARVPESPLPRKSLKYIAAFLVLAAGLGTGAAMLADHLDQRVHGPDDLLAGVGMRPVGWITAGADGRSRQAARDQLRRVALSLHREHRQRGTRRFVLTSVKGATDTALLGRDLAKELTDLGARVLTVDANADAAAPLDGQFGLIDVLEGEIPASTAIVREPLSHIPLGAGLGPGHLPSVQRLDEVLSELHDSFDMILVDAPSLLLSSDAELIVGASESTLLVVAAEADRLDEVRRALDMLENLAPPSVGLVLNRVRRGGGAPARSASPDVLVLDPDGDT